MSVVRHLRSTPVQIIGHARSGTSILADVLRRYLQISFGTESQYIFRFARKLSHYGDLSNEPNIRRLIADVCQERCFRRWRKYDAFVIDPEQVFRDLPSRTYRGVIESTFVQLARHSGMTRWGDKTPEYVLDLPGLFALFPDAQYVHIVRDGRDVALSILEQGFGAKNVYRAATDWRHQITLVQTFAATLPPEQYLEIRYEDFLGDTPRTFERLMAFLGVDIAPADVARLTRDLLQELKTGNFNKWRDRLSPAEQRLYERIAGDVLAHYGYDTTLHERQPLGLAQRCYWTVDDRIRQWLMPAYWSDNVYKAGVRLRALASPFRRGPAA
jgi:hypothetical protein